MTHSRLIRNLWQYNDHTLSLNPKKTCQSALQKNERPKKIGINAGWPKNSDFLMTKTNWFDVPEWSHRCPCASHQGWMWGLWWHSYCQPVSYRRLSCHVSSLFLALTTILSAPGQSPWLPGLPRPRFREPTTVSVEIDEAPWDIAWCKEQTVTGDLSFQLSMWGERSLRTQEKLSRFVESAHRAICMPFS